MKSARAPARFPVIRARSLFALLTALLAALTAPAVSAAEPEARATAMIRNVQFTNLTAREGLSAEFVHTVVQDAAGYLWFGTQEGLNRFDGHDIVVYEHDPRDPNTISNNFIWSLYVDAAGNLWVGTNRGINRYDYENDRFERDPLNLGVADRSLRVRTISGDHKGALWIGTVDQGLLSVADDSSLQRFRYEENDPDSLPSDNVIAIREDSKRRLWVGTDGGGLARLDRVKGSFIVYRHDENNPNSLSDNAIRSVYEDRSGNLWIGTSRGGLNLFLDTSGTFRHFRHDPEDPFSLSEGQVPSVLEDDKGTLWVGTESGLSEWRPAMQGFVHYRHEPGDVTSLVGNRVNALFQDASGVLWLATHGGLSSWNYFSDTFSYYQSEQGFLENDLVTSIAESRDGALWIGTYGGGLTNLDLSSGRAHHYRSDRDDPDSLADDRVMVVHVDALDRVWVGTRNGGLNLFRPDIGGFEIFDHDPADPNTLSGNAVTSIHTDPDGTLWVGVFDGGLNRASADQYQRFERFRHDPENTRTLSTDRVLSIHRDGTGVLWVGTEEGGLNRFEDGAFTRFSVLNQESGDALDAGTPWEILETRDGTFWIATMGEGLLRWNADDRSNGVARFLRYGKSAGLASTVYGLVEGNSGDIWLSSSTGLFRFNPANGATTHFDRHNGLRGTEFNHSARLRSRTGRLLFGGNNGIVGFFPGEVPQNDRVPQISLLASSRENTLVRATSDSASPAIQLGYLDPYIAFDFVALDFVSPDKNQYRYQLAGFDAGWTETNRFRRATYTNLPPGSYTFELQAANNDGVWNRDGVAIGVIVIPAPWRRWWAFVGYAGLLVLLVVWYLRAQAINRRREHERRVELERQVSERTTELATRNDELQSLNEKLAEASVTDSLTGLRNRRFVDQFISTEVSMVERRHVEGTPTEQFGDQRDSSKLLFFMMIDLDGFKNVNDTFGHHAGDEVLLQVKAALLECCRRSDVVIRWGGDEFMVIGHASRFTGVKVLAERIRESVAERSYDVGHGQVARLSASIGIAPYPFCETEVSAATWEQVSGIADQAAYLAKQNGRNAWVSIRGTETMGPEDALRMIHHLPELVEAGSVEVDSSFGPGVDLFEDESDAVAAAG